jgi:hypothetical protein
MHPDSSIQYCWSSILCAAACIAVPGLASPANPRVTGGYGGLYVRIDPSYVHKTSEFENALSKDFVDGAAIAVQWKDIEPEQGRYDFSKLDRWVDLAVEESKDLSFALMAGWFTPPWVYDAGAKSVTIRINRNPQNVGGPVCSDITLPVPWDPRFIASYNQAIASIAAHLRQMKVAGGRTGAAYKTVKIVKLSGINNTTEELRLPANRGDDGPCHQSDAQEIWAEAGFRPDRIIQAWTAISKATSAAFPDSVLSIATIEVGAFPPIDASGNIYRPIPGTTDSLTNQIIDIGLRKFPGRLAVQWNGLSQQEPDPAVAAAGLKGAIIGWQLNQSLGPAGGTACFYGHGQIGRGQLRVKCKSEADFVSILDQGVGLNGRFIEIWAPNVDEYADAFRRTHRRLKEGEGVDVPVPRRPPTRTKSSGELRE